MKNKEQKSPLFLAVKYLVRIFSPKMTLEGSDEMQEMFSRNGNAPFQEPVIIVANHSQMYGPIACELYLPDNCHIWCAGEMMKCSEVPAYAYQDFWSAKPNLLRPFYKVLSYLIAPLSVLVFGNARTIPVYKDSRLKHTFRDSLEQLLAGNSIVIFPEHNKQHNHIVYEFQEGFVDIARLYHKRTGKAISFVPMYICPALGKMCPGKPIRFSAQGDVHEERLRICAYLMQEITNLAEVLPRHRVVPYPNISKKLYPMNNTITENAASVDVHTFDEESL